MDSQYYFPDYYSYISQYSLTWINQKSAIQKFCHFAQEIVCKRLRVFLMLQQSFIFRYPGKTGFPFRKAKSTLAVVGSKFAGTLPSLCAEEESRLSVRIQK